MKYIRVIVSSNQGAPLYQHDFDVNKLFQEAVLAWVNKMVLAGSIKVAEGYDAIVIPEQSQLRRRELNIDITRMRHGEQGLLLVVDKQYNPHKPVKFFTLGVYMHEQGKLHFNSINLEQMLSPFFKRIEQKLIQTQLLQPHEPYQRAFYIRDDNEANLAGVFLPDVGYASVELLPEEEAMPGFPSKAFDDYTILATIGSPSRDVSPLIVIAQDTLAEMQVIARKDVQVEQGGVLVGDIYEPRGTPGYIVEISGHIQAVDAHGTYTELRYTYDVWQRQSQLLKEQFPGKRIIGWYHTHLLQQMYLDLERQELQKTEFFFSQDDIFMHSQFFREKWYVALVLNPVGDAAFFHWQGDTIVKAAGFFII